MVTGNLQGLIGLSVNATCLHCVGLPQCKPTQVSSLSGWVAEWVGVLCVCGGGHRGESLAE